MKTRVKWSEGMKSTVLEMAVRGEKWLNIAAALGKSTPACKNVFLLLATAEEIAARHKAVGYVERDRAVDGHTLPPQTDMFVGNVFKDITTRDYGRAPSTLDPRFSITPSSME